MVFEDFGFASYCSMPGAYLSVIDHQQKHSAFSESFCQLVVDVGFSFTHIIPVFNSRVVRAGVRRINVGGKLLTNLLKETVSYRQWNMMDDTAIVNQVKESLCYCSLDFVGEMKRTEMTHETRKEYVLPDYQTRYKCDVCITHSSSPGVSKQLMSKVSLLGRFISIGYPDSKAT